MHFAVVYTFDSFGRKSDLPNLSVKTVCALPPLPCAANVLFLPNLWRG